MSGDITEYYRSESTIVGNCNNLMVLVTNSAPSARDFDAVERFGCQVMARRWPSGMGLMLCTPAGVKPPDQAARERIIGTLKRFAPQMRAMACVVLGEGFVAATVRSVLAALSLGTRKSYPTKVFSDTLSGTAWLASQLDGIDGARFNNERLASRTSELATSTLPPPKASAG